MPQPVEPSKPKCVPIVLKPRGKLIGMDGCCNEVEFIRVEDIDGLPEPVEEKNDFCCPR